MPGVQFKLGIVENMPFEDYLAVPALSSSMLKVISGRSPLDMQRERQLERKQSPDMVLGTLFHLLALENPPTEEFQAQFVVAPKFNRRTKSGRAEAEAWEAQNTDKTVITDGQYFHAANMANAVHESGLGRALFAGGKPEVSVFWIDKGTGVPCKARFDWLPDGHDVIVDLKKVHSDEPGEISRTCGKFGYHIQEAWYKRAARAVGLPHRNFLFCFCLDKPRYTALWHYLDREEQQAGKIISKNALDTFAQCKQNNSWPGYLAEEEPQPLTIPKYLL